MLTAALIFTLLVVAWGSRALAGGSRPSGAPSVVGRDDPLSSRPRVDGSALSGLRRTDASA